MNTKRWVALGISADFCLLFRQLQVFFLLLFQVTFKLAFDEMLNPTSTLLAEEVIEEGNPLKKIAVLRC